MTRRRGLTILELMFGLVVVASVASIGTATLSLLANEGHDRQMVMDDVMRATAARRTLVEWLEGAHASVGRPGSATPGAFQLIDATLRGRDADVLIFTTAAATPLGTGETTVRLYIDEDDATNETGLTAELSSWPGGPTTRLQLDSTVTELKVRCLTTLLGGRRWVPSWVSTSVVPRGVELRLGGRGVSALLAMPLVVAVEGGR